MIPTYVWGIYLNDLPYIAHKPGCLLDMKSHPVKIKRKISIEIIKYNIIYLKYFFLKQNKINSTFVTNKSQKLKYKINSFPNPRLAYYNFLQFIFTVQHTTLQYTV